MEVGKKRMSWFDAMVALGVVLTFGYIIYQGLSRKHPKLKDGMRNFFGDGLITKKEVKPSTETTQQVWNERRMGI